MKLLTLITIAATATAITLAPAAAKSKKHYRVYPQQYGEYYGGWYGGGWKSRAVSDPSYVSPGYLRNKALGRCVEDLGYGRYEYCGW